ncbi:MAG: enoyl-CoA hydratase-related protein [Burkholderiaceae bacterium]
MHYETIRFEHGDGVARITLHRPERLNALCEAMFPELDDALEQVLKEKARVLVLSGAGRGFCAGADLEHPLGTGPASERDIGVVLERAYNPFIERLRSLPLPVISAVNGVAAGAGVSLALAADITIAAKSASFILAFARIGLIPDAGATYFLSERMGTARAMALALLGEKLAAVEAEQMGLIWKCVDDDALASTVDELALRLRHGPTLGLGLTKRAIYAAREKTLKAQLQLERELQAEAGKTHDFEEGVAAFLAKRVARFEGR